MNYFHAYWTRPQLNDAVPPESKDLELWGFELLVWVLSALEVQRHSPIRLVTDARGLRAVRNAGIDWLYHGGISTALERIPRAVDPRVFWAAGKLYAYREVAAPCVSLDTDAVLWRPLIPSAPVMVLHAEDRDWVWYKDNQPMFARYGFEGPEWDWQLQPCNAGAVCLGDQRLLQLYTDSALRFIEDYSDAHRAGATDAVAASVAMLFAEQRLLPMCAGRLGLAVAPITQTQPAAGWLPKNPDCLHLWRAKLAYKCCPQARRELVRWLLDHLLTQFPEVRPTLARWKLDALETTDLTSGLERQDLAQPGLGDLRFCLLQNLRGVVSVTDPVIGVQRRAEEGSLIWSAETVTPEPGASFDLVVAGKEAVSIRREL
jgi:hypothetical protein